MCSGGGSSYTTWLSHTAQGPGANGRPGSALQTWGGPLPPGPSHLRSLPHKLPDLTADYGIWHPDVFLFSEMD